MLFIEPIFKSHLENKFIKIRHKEIQKMDEVLLSRLGQVLTKLLAQKHQVVVLIRNPDLVTILDSNLKIIRSIYNPETYQNELSKCDVVISALETGTSRKPTNIYSKGGQQIISIMWKVNRKRLITLTTAAFDPTAPQYSSFLLKYVVRPLFKNIYSDTQHWETILENSKDIAWTIIRPNRLTNGPGIGNYNVELNHCPKGGSKISRNNLADFITKQIISDKYIHQKVAIAY